MNSQVKGALEDVKAVAAQIGAAVGPWKGMIPSELQGQIDSIQGRLGDAIVKLEALVKGEGG